MGRATLNGFHQGPIDFGGAPPVKRREIDYRSRLGRLLAASVRPACFFIALDVRPQSPHTDCDNGPSSQTTIKQSLVPKSPSGQ
jgi:hypothetical protein